LGKIVPINICIHITVSIILPHHIVARNNRIVLFSGILTDWKYYACGQILTIHIRISISQISPNNQRSIYRRENLII
jgi:hypothetical protein